MSPAATLLEALEPLRCDPLHSAVLLDIDGTLAPIVRHASDAHVPEATRTLLIEVARRYGLVGCVSGRRSTDARQIVAIGSIAYVGNHGGEILRGGSTRVEVLPEVAAWTDRVQEFVRRAITPEYARLRMRSEDKGAIVALHWRGVPDEPAAAALARQIAKQAEDEGYGVHWGRKVLEVRPPVTLDKGSGVRQLLRESAEGGAITAAVYVGDDRTDLDAFRGLRDLRDEGALTDAVCVAVNSDEAPTELVDTADVSVDSESGVRKLLQVLL